MSVSQLSPSVWYGSLVSSSKQAVKSASQSVLSVSQVIQLGLSISYICQPGQKINSTSKVSLGYQSFKSVSNLTEVNQSGS